MTQLNMSRKEVTASKIPCNRMLSFLVDKLGTNAPLFDPVLFSWAGRLCPSYSGGEWDSYSISNGGFYYLPPLPNGVILESPNGNSYALSCEAAGIVISLFALNHLSWTARNERICDLYHLLRDFAMNHSEAAKICHLID